MNEKQVLQAIENGQSAYGLLITAMPGVERKFNRICKSIVRLLAEVREEFPDAEYYTASGGFNLLLADSHNSETTRGQQQVVALIGTNVEIGDGDF